MENTRVEKYKSYRQSLSSQGTYDFSKTKLENSAFQNKETTTLPIDEVILEEKKTKSDKFRDWIVRNWYILKIIAIAIGLCLGVAVIILLIIFIVRS